MGRPKHGLDLGPSAQHATKQPPTLELRVGTWNTWGLSPAVAQYAAGLGLDVLALTEIKGGPGLDCLQPERLVVPAVLLGGD